MHEDEMIRFFESYSIRLMTWGSDRVIREWSDLQRKFRNSENDSVAPAQLLFDLEHFLLTMRKDLGHDNAGMRTGDLLRAIVKDVDDFLPSPPAGKRIRAT